MGNAIPQAAAYGHLFDDIQGEVLGLTRALVARLEALPKPLALCQLNLSQDDYAFLLSWAQQVSPHKIDQWLTLPRVHERFGCSPQEALGLMISLLASEVGRREAQEGTLWSVVLARFAPAVQARLFAQSHPRAEVKRALEAAADRFSLHHTFGQEGTQAYYTTVFMQFGFTRHGLGHLAQWLANPASQPTAVARLREESAEFARLWSALKQGQPDLTSPFLLPEWQVELKQSLQARAARAWLHWSGFDEPHFRVNLKEVFPQLATGCYEVELQGNAEWLTVDEGRYQPEWLTAEVPANQIQLNLDGESVEVLAWDDEEPFQAFSPEGRPCAVTSGRPLMLLLPRSVEPRPAGRWQNLGKSGYRVHSFAEGLLPDHQFFENEVLIHALEGTSRPEPVEEMSLSLKDQLICLLPHTVDVQLQAPYELRSVYFGSQSLKIDGGGRIRVPLDCSLTEPQLRLRCYFAAEGRNFQRTLKHPLRLEVATWLDHGEWRRFEYLDELECSLAHQARFLVEPRRFGLVEGDIFLDPPRTGTQRLPQLAGYGGSLQLRHGPYGPQDQLPRTLARSVVSRGCFSAEARPIELSSEHRFLHWDGTTPPCWSEQREGAVGLAFRGVRLGAEWSHWQPPQEIEDPRLFAHLLRWLHFPLLQQLEQLQPLLLQHPLEVLQAWLVDRHFVVDSERLELPESDGWLSVVGAYFNSWRPEAATAAQVQRLVPVSTLLRAHLLLAFRVARDGCSQPEKLELLKDLLKRTDIPPNPASRAAQLGHLRSIAADKMNVAPEYLLTLVNQLVLPEWGDDLRIALRNHHFQEYVLAQLLLKHLFKD